MLGKLTRWLRMLGHDVKYSRKLVDNQLKTIAKKEERILLTKDLELYQQAKAERIDAYYLKKEKDYGKLAELARRYDFKLDIDISESRCPKCNTRVEPISKKEVSDRVKQKTFNYYSKFWECPKCKQIYWQGAHWKGIKEKLQKAKEKSLK